ncbi:MAG: hypothetical protein NVS2B8_11210 [Vulcanimicrobiaceae bacterium]
MNLKKILGTVTAAIAITTAAVLYTAHPGKSSDHQDTYNLANEVGHNKSADITDVFVFPSPTNPANVVLAMDVAPLIPMGMGSTQSFDPTLMWQFKISHNDQGTEDQVIQFGVTAPTQTTPSVAQSISMYGPAAPNEVGTTNTFVKLNGSVNYNDAAGTVGNGTIKVFAGPRADPFAFDLFQFFKILPDRAYTSHTSQSDVGPGNTVGPNPTFNGFASTDTSGPGTAGYACSTAPPVNALADNKYNVLAFVVEMPKALLTTGFPSQKIRVWATVNSSTTTN